MKEKIVLIDGHSILNRAFYGVPDLTNKDGIHTNAIYGFLNILFKILEEEKPQYLVVTFDVSEPTFRHEIYKEYKGTRKAMPEELREQVPLMKKVLAAMDICIMEQAGLEADDIMGTIAKRAEVEGIEVSLVSGDRDLLQIASKTIKIRIPKTKMGKTEIEDYYEADVLEKYKVTPLQFIDLKALMGDSSDNIPGVPKVGEKTATALMVEYGSLEEIYNHVEEITKKSIKQSLIENVDMAKLSQFLATINVNSDIKFTFEEARVKDFFTKEAYPIFKKLEFRNYFHRFENKNDEENLFKIEEKFQVIDTEKEILEILEKISESEEEVGLLVVSKKDKILGLAVALSLGEVYFYQREISEEQDVQLSLFDLQKNLEKDTKLIQEALENAIRKISKKCFIYTLNIKEQYYFFEENYTNYFDGIIGAYLVNPLKNDYDGQAIGAEQLGIELKTYKEYFGKQSLEEVFSEKKEEVAKMYSYLAYIALHGGRKLKILLQEMGMEKLMFEVEMPLSYVLYDMEKVGVLVKPDELKAYGQDLVERINQLENSIWEKAGEKFNINSPKQLGEILFEKMKLPGGKKTKTGFSTAADVLEKLSVEFPIVDEILEYRTLAKLKSTYADGLANYIGEDNRIHSNFNQTITATGRISSTEPNLQNIPMKLELGRKIRKVFVPKEGCVLIDADYSQIELRVLAHMSGDKELIGAYKMDEDIHKITASKVFHIPFAEVTELQRRNAKAVNFGIVYGISSFGLSQDLSISRKEAATYIEQYFKTYPKIKSFLESLVEEGKQKGYVTTMFGRRRPIPELKSSNFMQRSFGERIAMNSPIQGTAADIIKIAMIRVWKALKEEKLESQLILQVHDELLIETKMEEKDRVSVLLEENMRKAAELAVSLEVDLKVGNTWYNAH